jgi:hypothetical protein
MSLSKFSTWSLLVALYVFVAASSFSGFFAKWAFDDGIPRSSFIRTLTGEASRPFVYRQLIPSLSRELADAIPADRRMVMAATWAKYRPLNSLYAGATEAETGEHIVEYHIAYMLCFGFWFLALVMLARVCLDATENLFASLAAPLVFAQIYPILMTRGGYFYDPPEIFFLATSVVLATRGRLLALLLLTPIATFNKESFLFWLPCLWPLFPASLNLPRRAIGVLTAVVASGCTYLFIKARYAANPGGAFEFHLLENIRFYLRPVSYFQHEYTYGLPLTRGVSFVHLGLLAALIYLGHKDLPARWKMHGFCALAVNLPLYLLFCWLDELRNLSLLFVIMTVLIASTLRRGLDGAGDYQRKAPIRAV